MVFRYNEGENIYVSRGIYQLLCRKNPLGDYDVMLIEGDMLPPIDCRGICLREGLTKKELDDLLTEDSVNDIFNDADEILLEDELYQNSSC